MLMPHALLHIYLFFHNHSSVSSTYFLTQKNPSHDPYIQTKNLKSHHSFKNTLQIFLNNVITDLQGYFYYTICNIILAILNLLFIM